MPRISPTGLGKKAYKDHFGSKNGQARKVSAYTLRAGERFHQRNLHSWWHTVAWVISLAAIVFFITLTMLFQTQDVLLGSAIFIALALILFFYFLRLDIRTRKDVTKLLPGKLVFDGHGKNKNEYLRSKKHPNFEGQPDFVYHLPKEDRYYVVDLKTCYAFPKREHRIKDQVQLAAYYLLLRERYGDKMLRYGYIIYQHRRNFKTKLIKVVFDDFAIQRAERLVEGASLEIALGQYGK